MSGTQPSIAEVAALVGNPARANILSVLLDGRALTATELAHIGGVSPQTASGHLSKLTEGGLLLVHKPAPRNRPRGRGDGPLRLARTCYDHLAGRLGVGAGRCARRARICPCSVRTAG
jgi:DNA-binding transcriptional ArsR family regulator